MKLPIYLDYNATTPLDPAVINDMLPYLQEHFGNPSSGHDYGVIAKKAVENARSKVCQMLGCQIDELIFTSGGSEANNYAIKGVASAYRSKGNHIITTQIEHPAVLEVCRFLEKKGYQITYLAVDQQGLIDPQELKKSISPRTILISIMHANNEVGTIQPITEISRIAHEHQVLVHSDCAQSVGKILVQVNDLDVDLLSIAGHKLYAPKGIGAIYIRTGVKIEKFIHGADHEMNLRAGTENVLEIVGFGRACDLVRNNLEEYHAHQRKMRDRLENGLKDRFPECQVNGHPDEQLPNTLSISFPGLEANTILAELKGVAASAGAACHSDQIDVSHVLEAMNVPTEYAMGTIRLSTGRFTTEREIDNAIKEICDVVTRLKPTKVEAPYTLKSSEIKLTHFTHGLGCACKLRPQLLEEVIKKLPLPKDKNILVGTETADDAAVYQISDDIAIIQTVDFFTPIVDDPFQFGAIAASNSLSDVYAMGGKPIFALNIVGFPSNRLPTSVLGEILAGAQSIAEEAQISIIGGHTVDDTEPKFGLAVTGIVHPDKIIKNDSARGGDVLILTKPLGTGILSTALKQGLLDEENAHLLQNTMTSLNKEASELMQVSAVNACTDVTGFGLLGHLWEMVKGSDTSVILKNESIPFLPGVQSLVTANVIPGGTRDNFQYTLKNVEYSSNISEKRKFMLNDAQTSGGLLISVEKSKGKKLRDKLIAGGVPYATVIGEVIPKEKVRIKVV
jgi:cysteine desulfurase NifS/selenium donor protein